MGVKEDGVWGSFEIMPLKKKQLQKRRKPSENSLVSIALLREGVQRASGMPQSPLSPHRLG